VAEAWRHGGFAQVDKLFARPPQSTHQVLHPAAWVAGEEPAKLSPPPLPPGAKLLARGKMGELGTRLALEACLDPSVGREFVPSWAGDAFAIYELHGHAELIWESEWSGGGAENIANLLRLLAPCWREQEGVAQEVHIGRKGKPRRSLPRPGRPRRPPALSLSSCPDPRLQLAQLPLVASSDAERGEPAEGLQPRPHPIVLGWAHGRTPPVARGGAGRRVHQKEPPASVWTGAPLRSQRPLRWTLFLETAGEGQRWST